MPDRSSFERRLRLSGLLMILGLLVEALCLVWRGPLAFLVFLGFGGAFLFAGIAVYLLSVVSIRHRSE
jgi:hypothetical protein